MSYNKFHIEYVAPFMKVFQIILIINLKIKIKIHIILKEHPEIEKDIGYEKTKSVFYNFFKSKKSKYL